ncbi:MAG: thiamine phosphate synthase [Thermodesulfobacteriota bacterium]
MGGRAGERWGRSGGDGGKSPIRGLYAIVDAGVVPLERVRNVAEQLLGGGVKILQLRAKGVPGGEFLTMACQLRELTFKSKALFIVNDRVDIAMAGEADGVHLGQDDIPVEEARALLGDKYLIGFSTHNLAEAAEAQGTTADYVSFGPVFATTTKEDAEPTLGIKALEEARALVKKPLVAIGGIREETLPDVISHGADAAAIISDILHCPDPGEKAARMISLFKKSRDMA